MLLKHTCFVAMIFFLVMAILRTICYLLMHAKLMEVDKHHTDKGLGSFVAEYVDGSTPATIVALCLLIYMTICYLSNVWIIHNLKRLITFVED